MALQDADTPPRTDGKAPRRSADILPCPICFQRFDADALEGHVVNCISNDENTELQRRVRRDLDIARRLQDQIRADEEQVRLVSLLVGLLAIPLVGLRFHWLAIPLFGLRFHCLACDSAG